MTDRDTAFHDAPLDEALTASLSAQHLVVRRVDDTARDDVDPWVQAVARGFLDAERNETQRAAFFDRTAHRRKLGVYDQSGPQPELPIATFASWGTDLTLPGSTETYPTVPVCAISSVTVAPTHRRRGVLRAVMSGELRVAAALGYPVAALTVSESGIYGRFGFAPAALATHWTIDVRRAGWVGPEAPGRIDFVSREQGRALAEALHARTRATMPGEVPMPGGHWDRFFGTRPDEEKPGTRRVAQYRDADGAVDGLVVYSVTEGESDFASSTLEVSVLLAATDDAYAGLWRFLLSMDLIGTIRIGELSVDEPLWWMLADQRAAKVTLRDHHYLRILDVPAALSARDYDVADTVVLEVTDPFDIAAGTFVLTTDSGGSVSVDVVDDAPVGLPRVQLGVAALSAMLLGGVSPVTLARAGRLQATDAPALARLFGSTSVPQLSFWY